MSQYMLPFTSVVNLQYGDFHDAAAVTTRRLSDMRGMFADAEAEAALEADDPVIYEVFYAALNPEQEGQLNFCTTVLRPGKVGREYFMTKGHFHAKLECAELYYCLQGEGKLLLQTPEGEVNVQDMSPGVAAYVPPFWGHRTVNTGGDNFVFLAVFPADAGYNYGIIEEQGFAWLLVEQDGEPQVIPNPKYGEF